MISEVQQFYGNKLRVRVCGICHDEKGMLMVNHTGVTNGNFWAPPGGGLLFGENVQDCLIREFAEETGLNIKVDKFLFACEMIKQPLHAIELFFLATILSGELKTGIDPETSRFKVIENARFLSWQEIQSLRADEKHGIFKHLAHPSKIYRLNGFYEVG